MPEPPEFSPIRTAIAGMPVVEIARKFGTPTYVYDSGEDRRTARGPGGFRHRPLRPEGLFEPGGHRPDPPARRELVDTVSAGDSRAARPPATSPEAPMPIVYTADIFDAEAARPGRRGRTSVNCGSPDMIDQYGSRAAARQITADQPGLRPRPQPEDEHRRRSLQARYLARPVARLPGQCRQLWPLRLRAAHAHWFGDRPGTRKSARRWRRRPPSWGGVFA